MAAAQSRNGIYLPKGYHKHITDSAISLCPTFCTLAVLNIELPEPENSGSISETPINLVHLLAMMNIYNQLYIDFN
jgi:hypothetical protein